MARDEHSRVDALDTRLEIIEFVRDVAVADEWVGTLDLGDTGTLDGRGKTERRTLSHVSDPLFYTRHAMVQ